MDGLIDTRIGYTVLFLLFFEMSCDLFRRQEFLPDIFIEFVSYFSFVSFSHLFYNELGRIIIHRTNKPTKLLPSTHPCINFTRFTNPPYHHPSTAVKSSVLFLDFGRFAPFVSGRFALEAGEAVIAFCSIG